MKDDVIERVTEFISPKEVKNVKPEKVDAMLEKLTDNVAELRSNQTTLTAILERCEKRLNGHDQKIKDTDTLILELANLAKVNSSRIGSLESWQKWILGIIASAILLMGGYIFLR